MAAGAKLIIEREIEEIRGESTSNTLKRKKLKNGRILSVAEMKAVKAAAGNDRAKLKHLQSIWREPMAAQKKRGKPLKKKPSKGFDVMKFLTSK